MSQSLTAEMATLGQSIADAGVVVDFYESLPPDQRAYYAYMSKVATDNTAASAKEAEKQRTWQEQQNKIAMDYNMAEAAKNRDWQEYMSNTAHQREVADLKAAGLNPILSAMGGNGASVGSGATAVGVTSTGAKGEVDTSLTGALVSMLGTMINAQTNMALGAMSANTNLAVAQRNASAAQYAADMSYAANKYGWDKQEYLTKNYPNNMWSGVSALLGAILGGDPATIIGNMPQAQLLQRFNNWFSGEGNLKKFFEALITPYYGKK